MSLVAKSSGSNFKPVPQGQHPARCYRIIDLGTQYSERYQNHSRKIMVQFEVHGEDEKGEPTKTEKGEPMSISKNYTLSLSPKSNLYSDLISWRGVAFEPHELAGFELKNILGHWALINVIKSKGDDGKEYTNISAITKLPKAMRAGLPEGHNTPAMFNTQEPDMALFETFGERIKQTIMKSPEFQAAQSRGASSAPAKTGSGFDDMDDDIPF